MSDTTPETGEIWQDSEGVLLTITHGGEKVIAFGVEEVFWIKHMHPADQPAKRVFDATGRYVGDGALDYPTGNALVPRGERDQVNTDRAAYYAANLEGSPEEAHDKRFHGDDDGVHLSGIVQIGEDGGVEVVRSGSDGMESIDPNDPDIPEPIRRMIAAITGGPPSSSKPNRIF